MILSARRASEVVNSLRVRLRWPFGLALERLWFLVLRWKWAVLASSIFVQGDWEELTFQEQARVVRLIGSSRSGCIWPAPYHEDSAEAAFRFLTECWWTDNEADQSIELIPAKAFVWEFVKEWHGARGRRQPFIIEKVRRMMISWICRGLETWAMGLSRGSWIIIDQNHANAAEHLWRIDFALNQLYERRPELKLRRHKVRGAVLIKQPTHLLLANGSQISQAHQEAGAAQGKGKTGVTLEEISKYAAPSAFWGQALIVTQGKGGAPGGWVCAIANASPKADWRAIKGEMDARKFLGLGRGV